MRPLIDDLSEKFMKFYTPSQNIALDESLLLFKGRLLFRQYLPAKRSRFGIKIYSISDQNGYVYHFRVYTGATDKLHDVEAQLPDEAKRFTKTEQLVIYMMLPLLNKGYSLYVDNFYSSTKLFEFMHQKMTNMCGTVRRNRVPDTVKSAKIGKGECKAFVCGNLMCTKYVDKKEVYLLSTAFPHGTTEVRVRGRYQRIAAKPNCIQQVHGGGRSNRS